MPLVCCLSIAPPWAPAHGPRKPSRTRAPPVWHDRQQGIHREATRSGPTRCSGGDVRRGLVYGCACGSAAVGQLGGSTPLPAATIDAYLPKVAQDGQWATAADCGFGPDRDELEDDQSDGRPGGGSPATPWLGPRGWAASMSVVLESRGVEGVVTPTQLSPTQGRAARFASRDAPRSM